MKLSAIALSSLVSLALAAPQSPPPAKDAATPEEKPTLYLCGDMGNSTNGFGEPLKELLTITTVNKAVANSSSRSYTMAGYFAEVAKLLKKDDIVLIEFGLNDGAPLGRMDNGQGVCPGSGVTRKCHTRQINDILTYTAYIYNAAKLMVSKGAKVIVSGPIPRNPYQSGKYSFQPSVYNHYAETVAWQFRDLNTVEFVNHELYAANKFYTLGRRITSKFYTESENTYPNADGTKVLAEAFIEAVMCAEKSFLMPYLSEEGKKVKAVCELKEGPAAT